MTKAIKRGAERHAALAAPEQLERAGWTIPAWCNALSISRAGFYNLPIPPHTAHVGRRHIVREPPGAYLARVAAAQAGRNV